MKFPNIQDLKGYPALLEASGCKVQVAEDTGRFAPYVDLYLDMLNKQLTYDALRIIGFDLVLMQAHGRRDGLHATTGPRGQNRPGHFHRHEKPLSAVLEHSPPGIQAKAARSIRPAKGGGVIV